MSFASHSAAMEYVKKVGLDKQYAQAQPNTFAQLLTAGGVAA
ncbi:hypothetical protein [Ferribacterium limneticum]|nr:hypothetical protein [Ferribacterium limneticum]